MSFYLYILFLMVGLGASVVGAICGIGGGVLMKPILDAFGVLSVSTISFISSCTVLSMTSYSVAKSRLGGKSQIDMAVGTPLAVGAAIGGVIGKQMFQFLSGLSSDPDRVGAIQAACLLIITFGTMLYTVSKSKISTRQVSDPAACVGIGMALGICSSFLGIGGGPINLVVLFYFFSMQTKQAAENSLYIILFSQIASLLITLITRSVPSFEPGLLVLMVCGGIAGGAVGRKINSHISEDVVNRLFIVLMVLIMLVNVYNIYQFM